MGIATYTIMTPPDDPSNPETACNSVVKTSGAAFAGTGQNGKSRSEQLFSDLPPEADLTADIVEVSQVPKNDITYRFHSGGHIATLSLVFVH
jgi:hypothetical protein